MKKKSHKTKPQFLARLDAWALELGKERRTLARVLKRNGVDVVAGKLYRASEIFNGLFGEEQTEKVRNLKLDADEINRNLDSKTVQVNLENKTNETLTFRLGYKEYTLEAGKKVTLNHRLSGPFRMSVVWPDSKDKKAATYDLAFGAKYAFVQKKDSYVFEKQ